MDFTLKYAGELKSYNAKHSKQAKHEIRCRLHRQLAELWRTNFVLKQYDPPTLQRPVKDGKWYDVERPLDKRGPFWRADMGGHDFVPLVNHVHRLHCHLAIRLHRPQEPGGIVYEGGDLDHGLSTLLDALSMPQDENQTVQDPKAPNLIFCLLESDELITKVSVETFTLLDTVDAGRNHVEMDIDVHISPVIANILNIGMLFP